jgi:hypothetical protein
LPPMNTDRHRLDLVIGVHRWQNLNLRMDHALTPMA